MKKIFLSPSNQNYNQYNGVDTIEAEQCGKIANALKAALERCGGFEVKLMHMEAMADKVKAANAWGADYYIPIHTNAGGGNGTRLFYYTTNGLGHQLCKAISKYLFPLSPGTSDRISFNDLYETRNPKAPVAYCEVDFHDCPEIAKWIEAHTEDIAEAICKGVCDQCGVAYVAPDVKEEKEPVPAEPAENVLYIVQAGAYRNPQNAENMLKLLAAAGIKGYIKKEKR